MSPFLALVLIATVSFLLRPAPPLQLINDSEEIVCGRAVKDWPKLWVEQKFADETKLSIMRNGRCGYQMQPGVWAISLARPTKTNEKAECHIPANSFLFVELISSAVFSNKDDGNCQEPNELAHEIVDEVTDPEFEYDGIRLRDLNPHRRAIPDCPNPHRFTNQGRLYPTSGADGYFLMFQPVTQGTHKISFVASHRCWFDQEASFSCPESPTRRKVNLNIVFE